MAQQLLGEISLSIIKENGERENDNFWVDSERSTMSALMNLMIEYASAEQCVLPEIVDMLLQDGDSLEKGELVVSGGLLKDIMNVLPNGATKRLLGAYADLSANTTRSCIQSGLFSAMSKYISTDAVINLIAGDDLDLFNWDVDVDQPFIIYILIPDQSDVFDSLAGLLVSQISNLLIMLADRKYGGRLPARVNFILEELGNIGQAVPNLPHLISASRSRNIRMTLVLQALTQLNSIYGESNAATILANIDVWTCFRTNDWNTAKEFSEKCGSKLVQAGDIRYPQELISPQQLIAMDTLQALVFVHGGRLKYIEQFPGYREMFDCSELVKVPIPEAKKIEKHKPICLEEMRNQIMAGRKANTSGSIYRRLLLSKGEEHE